MPIHFQSFASSSAGNCLAIWDADTSILVDCGLKTLRDCRALVAAHRDAHGPVTALLVTHAHGDHLSRSAFRVMAEEDIPIRAHPVVVPQLRDRHDEGRRRGSPIQPFPEATFELGTFRVTAVRVPHAPGVPNVGLVVRAGHGSRARKIVVCTDFWDYDAILPEMADADFVFVEANHDPGLLRAHPNPSSAYHLSNARTARLLTEAVGTRLFAPGTVVLGHLSEERNDDRLATREVERGFRAAGRRVPFELHTAPKFTPSPVFLVR